MKNLLSFLLFASLSFVAISRASAQCPVGVSPSYSSGCTDQYFTSVTASGVGVVSTISYTGSSCVGPFFDMFAVQGVTAPTGTTVNINVSRVTTYYAYLAVYVDWNNNGVYQTTELVGSVITMPAGLLSAVYSFTIPLTGITTNTNLHMRVFLGEPAAAGGPLSSINPPCSAKWGQSNDYYIRATCTDPTIAVTPASPTVCGATGSVALTASGAGPTPTYVWSPGATLSASTGATVTSTPGVATTYTVTGYGPGVCAATATVPVAVDPGFTAAITATGTTTVCPGGNVTLTETSGSGVSFQWYNGPTLIAGATNSSYVAAPPATTTYSVIATNAAGCTSTATRTVTILATPVATITPVGSTTVCSPNTVQLNATLSPGYTYRWFNTSGLIAGATNQSYTVTATGSFSVEVTAPTGCMDTSAITSVTINPSPTALASASGPLVFCSYSSVTLTAVTPPYTYRWLDGTTPIPGATNASFTTSAVGTHDYRLRVTNGFGCSDTTAPGLFTVVVNPAPVSTISASGPLSFCSGSNVTLSVLSVAGYIYEWYFGPTAAAATAIPGGTASSYIASATGYYYVKVTTPAGCTTNSLATPALVTVVTLPHIMYSTPLNFCWGSNVHLSLGISSSAPGISFQWKRNGADIPGAISSVYDATITGIYTCVVSVSGSCTGATPPVSVNVYSLPDPVVTYSGGKLRTGMFYTSYQWYKNLIPIPGATTYMITPLTPANYSVIVTDTNRCISKASSYPLTVVAVNDLSGNMLPAIYPNPSTGKIYIDHADNLVVVISSVDGKTQLEVPAARELDISSIASGLYIISLYNGEGKRVLVEKLVKQ